VGDWRQLQTGCADIGLQRGVDHQTDKLLERLGPALDLAEAVTLLILSLVQPVEPHQPQLARLAQRLAEHVGAPTLLQNQWANGLWRQTVGCKRQPPCRRTYATNIQLSEQEGCRLVSSLQVDQCRLAESVEFDLEPVLGHGQNS